MGVTQETINRKKRIIKDLQEKLSVIKIQLTKLSKKYCDLDLSIKQDDFFAYNNINADLEKLLKDKHRLEKDIFEYYKDLYTKKMEGADKKEKNLLEESLIDEQINYAEASIYNQELRILSKSLEVDFLRIQRNEIDIAIKDFTQKHSRYAIDRNPDLEEQYKNLIKKKEDLDKKVLKALYEKDKLIDADFEGELILLRARKNELRKIRARSFEGIVETVTEATKKVKVVITGAVDDLEERKKARDYEKQLLNSSEEDLVEMIREVNNKIKELHNKLQEKSKIMKDKFIEADRVSYRYITDNSVTYQQCMIESDRLIEEACVYKEECKKIQEEINENEQQVEYFESIIARKRRKEERKAQVEGAKTAAVAKIKETSELVGTKIVETGKTVIDAAGNAVKTVKKKIDEKKKSSGDDDAPQPGQE